MTRTFACVVAILFPCAVYGGEPVKFLPPPGKCHVFVGGGYDFEKHELEKFEQITGFRPSGRTGCGESGFDSAWGFMRHQTQDHPGSISLTLQMEVEHGGFPVKHEYQKVLSGYYDSEMDRFGINVRDSGIPFFISIGGESALPPHKNYDATTFIKAFRYIHDRWQKLGVDNVAYVWGPGKLNEEGFQFYPGDDYVDYIAFPCYEAGAFPPNRSYYKVLKFARAHHKAPMVAEVGPIRLRDAQRWNTFFRPFFAFCRAYDIRVITLNNQTERLGTFEPSAIYMFSKEVQRGLRKELSNPRYLPGRKDNTPVVAENNVTRIPGNSSTAPVAALNNVTRIPTNHNTAPVGKWLESRPDTPVGDRVRTFLPTGVFIFELPKKGKRIVGSWRREGDRVYFSHPSPDGIEEPTKDKWFQVSFVDSGAMTVLMEGQRHYVWKLLKK